MLCRNSFTNHRDYFKINGHFLKSYHYKAEAWLLSSKCFIAATFLHFGNCAVYSASWSESRSKAWNCCECCVLMLLLSLIHGLYCCFVECSGVSSLSFGVWGWVFIFREGCTEMIFQNSSCFHYFWHNRTESSSTAGLWNPQFCDLLFDIFLSSYEHFWR